MIATVLLQYSQVQSDLPCKWYGNRKAPSMMIRKIFLFSYLLDFKNVEFSHEFDRNVLIYLVTQKHRTRKLLVKWDEMLKYNEPVAFIYLPLREHAPSQVIFYVSTIYVREYICIHLKRTKWNRREKKKEVCDKYWNPNETYRTKLDGSTSTKRSAYVHLRTAWRCHFECLRSLFFK